MSAPVDYELMENSPGVRDYYQNKKLFYQNVFWLTFGNMVLVFGLNSVGALINMHMAGAKLDPSQISIIMALGTWIGIPLYLYFSHLSDNWQWKWGRRLPFVALAQPLLVIGIGFFPYTQTFVSCLFLYLIYIGALQIKAVTYPMLTNDTCKKLYWGRVTGIIILTGNVTAWLGQVKLLGLVDTKGEHFVFWTIAAISTIATCLTLIFVKEPSVRSSEVPKFNPVPVIWSTLKYGFTQKKHILAFIAYALCGSTFIPILMISLQAKTNLGLSQGEVGIKILQYGTIAMAVAAYMTGWTIDKLGVLKSVGLGLLLNFFAVLLGTNPAAVSKIIGMSPETVLVIGYTAICVGHNQIFTSVLIFIQGRVPREEVSRICACCGTVALLNQSFVMMLSGALIKWVFNYNYGVSFAIAYTLSLCGGILLFKIIKSERIANSTALNQSVSSDKNNSYQEANSQL